MSTTSQHYAKNVFFGCIDDRLVETHLNFIIKIGGAFYPAVAGGGLAFIDPLERETAIKQVVVSYKINHINTVYIESHTGCGAYGLSGIEFHSPEEELAHLYSDLDQATKLIEDALAKAGAKPGEVTVHVRVVDPSGQIQSRPKHTAATF